MAENQKIKVTKTSSSNGGKPSSWMSMRAKIGLVVVPIICVIIGFLVLDIGSVEEDADSTPQKKKTTGPGLTKFDETPIERRVTKPETSAAKVEKVKKEYVKKPGQMQLPDGRVLTFPVPKEGEFRTVHSHGKMYKCDHLGNWEDVTPKPIFDNAFEENLIGLSMAGGTFMPGMLTGLDQESVMKMLKKPVVINPDDSEEVATKKQFVAEAKQEILAYIEQGGTFDEYVMAMRDTVKEERKAKSAALRDVVSLIKAGHVKEAKYYREIINKEMQEKGMLPIRFPAHINEILDN